MTRGGSFLLQRWCQALPRGPYLVCLDLDLSHCPHFTAKEKEHREDEPIAQVSQLVNGRGWLRTRPSGS